EVPVPRALADRRAEPEIQEILGGEQTLFESRRTARTGQKAQLSERTKQLKEDRGTDRAATGQGRRDQARQDRARRTARALGQRTCCPSANTRPCNVRRHGSKANGRSSSPPSPRRAARSQRPNCRSFRSIRICAPK